MSNFSIGDLLIAESIHHNIVFHLFLSLDKRFTIKSDENWIIAPNVGYSVKNIDLLASFIIIV